MSSVDETPVPRDDERTDRPATTMREKLAMAVATFGGAYLVTVTLRKLRER